MASLCRMSIPVLAPLLLLPVCNDTSLFYQTTSPVMHKIFMGKILLAKRLQNCLRYELLIGNELFLLLRL